MPASYTIVHNKKHKSVKVATVVLPLLLSVRLNAIDSRCFAVLEIADCFTHLITGYWTCVDIYLDRVFTAKLVCDHSFRTVEYLLKCRQC